MELTQRSRAFFRRARIVGILAAIGGGGFLIHQSIFAPVSGEKIRFTPPIASEEIALPSPSAATPQPTPTPQRRPVITKQLANKVKLGITRREVHRRLGKPDEENMMPIPGGSDNAGLYDYLYVSDSYWCRDGVCVIDYNSGGIVISIGGNGFIVGNPAPF
jgi:hypothetical protein